MKILKVIDDIAKIKLNDVNLDLRMAAIHKSETAILKLKGKLLQEENYYKQLLKEAKEFCEEIQKGEEYEEPRV